MLRTHGRLGSTLRVALVSYPQCCLPASSTFPSVILSGDVKADGGLGFERCVYRAAVRVP